IIFFIVHSFFVRALIGSPSEISSECSNRNCFWNVPLHIWSTLLQTRLTGGPCSCDILTYGENRRTGTIEKQIGRSKNPQPSLVAARLRAKAGSEFGSAFRDLTRQAGAVVAQSTAHHRAAGAFPS